MLWYSLANHLVGHFSSCKLICKLTNYIAKSKSQLYARFRYDKLLNSHRRMERTQIHSFLFRNHIFKRPDLINFPILKFPRLDFYSTISLHIWWTHVDYSIYPMLIQLMMNGVLNWYSFWANMEYTMLKTFLLINEMYKRIVKTTYLECYYISYKVTIEDSKVQMLQLDIISNLVNNCFWLYGNLLDIL